MVVEVLVDLAVVTTDVPGIPAVATDPTVGEGRMLTLERRVATAHDGLTQIFETVADVPGHVILGAVGVGIRLHAIIGLKKGILELG
jgi:hypothetical protein